MSNGKSLLRRQPSFIVLSALGVLGYLGLTQAGIASTPPPGPINPGPVVQPTVNEDVNDTVTLDATLGLNALRDGMRTKLRPNRGLTHLIPTSIYVEEGEYLRLSALENGNARLCINTLEQRALCEFKTNFSDYERTIRARATGEVYVENLMVEGNATTEVTITGGQSMPTFVSGDHTDSDFTTMLAEAKTPNIHLVSDRMIITGPVEKFLRYKVTNPVELMNGWDNIISEGQLDYGFSPELSDTHKPMSHKALFLDVGEDGWGFMYASSYHLGTGSNSAFDRVVKTSNLLGGGGWGPWHEYGHTLQPKFIQFNGMTEVTVNITSLNVQRRLGGESRIAAKWDSVLFPYLDQPNDSKDFFNSNLGLFDKLGLFWQFDLSFGPRFYQRIAANMRNHYVDDDALHYDGHSERVQSFIQQASLATGYDLRDHFAKWGIHADETTNRFIDSRSGLELAPSFSENSDISQPYTDHHFGSDVSLDYKAKAKEIVINYDFYRTWQPGQRATVFVNNKVIGSIEANQSQQFRINTLGDDATTKAVIKHALKKGDSVAITFDNNGNNSKTYKLKINDVKARANASKDRLKVRLNKRRFNNTSFELKAYANHKLLFSCANRKCDGATVRIKNKRAIITHNMSLEAHESIRYVVTTAKGQFERVVYAH